MSTVVRDETYEDDDENPPEDDEDDSPQAYSDRAWFGSRVDDQQQSGHAWFSRPFPGAVALVTSSPGCTAIPSLPSPIRTSVAGSSHSTMDHCVVAPPEDEVQREK
jgi:hypothetical protein